MLKSSKLLRTAAITLCCGMLSMSYARADSIELRDGRHVHGKYLGGSATAVGFMSDRAVEYFPTSSVLVLVFDPSGVDERSNNFEFHPIGAKRGAKVRRAVVLRRVDLNHAIR